MKDKDFGLKLEPAKPAVDRPVVSLSHYGSVPSCHTSAFIMQTKHKHLQEKRNITKGYFTVYTMKHENLVLSGLNISPQNNEQ